MITTNNSLIRLRRFAAKKLVRGNLRSTPSSKGSLLLASSSQSTLTWFPDIHARSSSDMSTHKYQPMEDLFQSSKQRSGATSIVIGDDFIGRTARINRVFGPGANAQALLTTGGEELAQQASFDPDYKTAKGWIRSRPVGPAVLSSTLLSGLIGALTEASFPQTVPVSSSMSFLHPLIVGMEVTAAIKVESVEQKTRVNGDGLNGSTNTGYEIVLSTQVTRAQDDVIIAEGFNTVWIPGYL